jgi:hypothetical protein
MKHNTSHAESLVIEKSATKNAYNSAGSLKNAEHALIKNN